MNEMAFTTTATNKPFGWIDGRGKEENPFHYDTDWTTVHLKASGGPVLFHWKENTEEFPQ